MKRVGREDEQQARPNYPPFQDSEFKAGCATGAVQSLPSGLHIAMNGGIWDPAEVRMNVAATRFEVV